MFVCAFFFYSPATTETNTLFNTLSRHVAFPSYRANRVNESANIHVVPGRPVPDELHHLTNPLVVGLTASPDRLISVRRNRLIAMNESVETEYVDAERVREELNIARKDRKSVVEGKRVSVRVDLGGRRLITKNKNTSTFKIKSDNLSYNTTKKLHR